MLKKFLTSSLMLVTANVANAAGDSAYKHEAIIVQADGGDIATSGSAQKITEKELERYNYENINNVLRSVPGVKMYDEDGYGNRPNIGFRGAKSERSKGITLMEDGILIAPAPYASPSAYYFPKVERMSSIEILKGAAAVKTGPRTTSGALNMITKAIPEKNIINAGMSQGTFNSDKQNISVGTTKGRFGVLLDYNQMATDGFKELDGGGNTGFEIEDFMSKFRVTSKKDAKIYQQLELKFATNDESSNETYLGLTDADFATSPYRRYKASAKDNFVGKHRQIQLTHYIEPTDNISVATTLYNNEFQRNWYKLDRIYETGTQYSLSSALSNATVLDILKGNTDTDGVSNTYLDIKANNREYDSKGISSVANFSFGLAGSTNKLEIGFRYHEDDETQYQHRDSYDMKSGVLLLKTAGAAGSANNSVKSAKAFASYIQDEITMGRFVVTPGVRYESVEISSVNRATNSAVTRNTTDVAIPAISLAFNKSENTKYFVGIHKGFAAATNTNHSNEKSTNYEMGVRYLSDHYYHEIVGFLSKYSNLLESCSFASGTNCNALGAEFSAGRVEVKGLEASMEYNLANKWYIEEYRLPIRAVYSYTVGQFEETFNSTYALWGNVKAGYKLPYLPKNQLFLSVGVEKKKWSVEASMKFQDEMRTVAGQFNPAPSERVDHFHTIDLAASYNVNDNIDAFVTVTNIADNKYIASRTPSGARPGAPRMAYVGVKFKF